MSNDIHMHNCPKCGRGWDCTNECGDLATEGTLTRMICGLCTEHVVGLSQVYSGQKPWWAVDSLTIKSEPTIQAPVAAREAIMHSHTCIIGNHLWQHDNAVCAADEIIDLECPECFTFIKPPCPLCGIGPVRDMPGFERFDFEAAYWCQPCNFIFRLDLYGKLV